MSKKADANKSMLHLRMHPHLHKRLTDAAMERDISANLLANKAIEYYLDHLIPIEDMIDPVRLNKYL